MMRNVLILIFSTILLFSCKSKTDQNEVKFKNTPISYPSELMEIFNAHGTLIRWKEMKSLSYEIVKEGENEQHLIDLKSRNERIEGSNFKTGFNGKEYWLEADTSYKGNAKFYHNLMFYFYAMPFVAADDGIIYSEAKPLIFEDKAYPGIRISYNQGVGESPEDEYFIHYDPNTHRMKWLGYTVTFFSGEKSKKVKWIRYNDWGPFSGLLLPKSLTWYNLEDGVLTEPREPTEFINIKLTKEQPDAQRFEKTENAIVVE